MKKTGYGEQLKEARAKEGMTQWDIARILGVTLNSVALWESGKSEPTRANKARITLWLNGDYEPLPEYKTSRQIESLAQRIIRLRAKYRISQKQLSIELGINKTTIHNWETGKAKPSEMYLECLREWEEDNRGEEHER